MLTTWEEYLEDLCTAYQPLAHMQGSKRAWIPYGSSEAAPEKGNLKPLYVKHQDFEAEGRDQSIWRYTSTLQVLQQVNISKGNAEAAIKTARQATLTVAQAIDARLIADYESGDSCLTIADLGEVTLKPIDLTDQSAWGWEMVIVFTGYRHEIDPDDWIYQP